MCSSVCNNFVSPHDDYTKSPRINELCFWHQRLGHVPFLSMKHIDFLSSKLNMSSYKTINCDVCHLARQTRKPFPLSNSHSSTSFELIHCDVWGPYKHATYDG